MTEELDFETRLDLLSIELKEIGRIIAEMKEKAEALQRLTEGN